MNDEVERAIEEETGPALPPFYVRFFQVFFSPGALMRALAAKPAWGVALLSVTLLVALQTALIPWEVMEAYQREAALRAGQEPQPMPENIGQIMQVATPIFGALGALLFTFLFAGVYTLIFAFVLGDEGKYRQYLAAATHATLIPVLVGLALVPLKISQQNPQFTVNLGAFFFFMPEGYLLKVFTMLDLSQIWATLVTATGVTAIDPRRSYASAATILLTVTLLVAMIFATFVPTV